jgi:hypothetical protein
VNGNPLGADAAHPAGQDLAFDFQVSGVEGRTGAGAPANDTPATAQELGDVTSLVQVAGAIGDDPNFAAIPGADVDVYHFRVTGPGPYALDAEAFAGRIDSPLDVGLALYQLDPTDGHTLRLVYANDNTLNGTPLPGGFTPPLFTDAAVFAALTAGDYYLVVSAAGNTPDTALGLAPGSNGMYDLNAGLPYSGPPGLSTGPYVLNVLLRPAGATPHVTAVTPGDGTALSGPPTHLAVQFDEPVTLQKLAFEAYQASQTTPGLPPDQLAAVFLVGPGGTTYFPRLESYDPSSSQASFLMLDALPNGSYELHFSGARGLTDFAGQPLVGNDPSGDYVVRFTVNGPVRGTPGNPTLWADQEPNDSLNQPQVLGPLFPHELGKPSQVTVVRYFSGNPASAPQDTADVYQIELLQDNRFYVFNLVAPAGSALPAGTLPEIYDAAGNLVATLQQGGTSAVGACLPAGTYRVRIAGWSPGVAAGVVYQLQISMVVAPEAPVPLVVGPAPAFRIRLVTAAPGVPEAPSAPPLALPAPPGGGRPQGDGRRAAPDTPASVLLALTAGPVGGPASGTATSSSADTVPVPGRLLVGGPELVARDRLIEVAVLTGVDGGGTEEDPPDDLQALVEDFAAQAVQSWGRAVDFFFGSDRQGAGAAAPGDLSGQDVPGGDVDSDPATDDPVTDDPGDEALSAPGPAGIADSARAPERGIVNPLPSALCLLPSAAWVLAHAGRAGAARRRRRGPRLPNDRGTGGGA